MTLDEAAAHVGNPVLIRSAPGIVCDGEITAVDDVRRLVGVRVRYRNAALGWRLHVQWWPPVHLAVPGWWTARQETAR